MVVKVRNLQGNEVGEVTLEPRLWDGGVNLRLLSQVVAVLRANQRAGTASTKTRGMVSGGGRKPWRQKHTGRARAGSIRSPLWRHGGIIFGPHPRSFRARLPERVRRRALLESLKGKLRDQELIVLDDVQADAPKTKALAGLANACEVTRKSVMVLEAPSEALVKSLRNLRMLALRPAASLNALDVLTAQKVLVTRAALVRLTGRVSALEERRADASGN